MLVDIHVNGINYCMVECSIEITAEFNADSPIPIFKEIHDCSICTNNSKYYSRPVVALACNRCSRQYSATIFQMPRFWSILLTKLTTLSLT